jgi:UDP-N-acetylglucosamine 3-dehydrogenase
VTRTRVGLVGAGVMGRRHFAALSYCDTADILGIADHHAESSDWPGVPVFRDLHDLLDLRPEAVIVATPAGSHRSVVEPCLAVGIHVLVEKPLATTVADAHAMVEAARRADCQLAVGHVERFSPAVLDIRRAMGAGAPTSVSTTRVGRRPPQVRDVGALLDLAVHDVDLVRWLTGREYLNAAVDVLATTDDGRETHARVDGVLDDGTRVTHEVSWLAERSIRRWTVAGERGRGDTVDLLSAGTGALVAQDEAFLSACRGGPIGALATAADGAAAVEVLALRRIRATIVPSPAVQPVGQAAADARPTAGGRS